MPLAADVDLTQLAKRYDVSGGYIRNAILLAVILGSMIAFDMGGPVNKAAFFFGAASVFS